MAGLLVEVCCRVSQAFACCLRACRSSFDVTAVGRGPACTGGRVVRARTLECRDRTDAGGQRRECAAVETGGGEGRHSGLAATPGHRSPAQAGRRPGRAGADRAGARRQAHGFEADLWKLERVGMVVEQVTGVVLSRASVWRLLTGRLGWSLQRPERRAVERDESEIARWIAHEWPRIKKGR
nr:winged helix-turn-helix domain-containing protein [Streptomyces sp. QHH-9511]